MSEKAKQGGGDVSEHDYTNNLPSINKMNVCMWVCVCDGIKLSVGRGFDPVVFLWLRIDTVQFYVHINAIGRI